MNAAMPATTLSFSVRDWFAWKPGHETRASWFMPGTEHKWQAPEGDPDWMTRPAAALPMMLRRRMSGLGQKIVGAALTLPAAKQARYVFASRHGEFATTLRILEDLHNRALPSPADFSLSVHHALAGLLSIQTGNREGHTTISAGRDTFGYGLLEAVTFCAERPGQSALLVAYDEPLPEPYAKFQEPDEAGLPLIVMLEITADAEASAGFSLEMRPPEVAATSKDGEAIPLGQCFLDFFLSDFAETSLNGDTLTWVLRRVASH